MDAEDLKRRHVAELKQRLLVGELLPRDAQLLTSDTVVALVLSLEEGEAVPMLVSALGALAATSAALELLTDLLTEEQTESAVEGMVGVLERFEREVGER